MEHRSNFQLHSPPRKPKRKNEKLRENPVDAAAVSSPAFQKVPRLDTNADQHGALDQHDMSPSSSKRMRRKANLAVHTQEFLSITSSEPQQQQSTAKRVESLAGDNTARATDSLDQLRIDAANGSAMQPPAQAAGKSPQSNRIQLQQGDPHQHGHQGRQRQRQQQQHRQHGVGRGATGHQGFGHGHNVPAAPPSVRRSAHVSSFTFDFSHTAPKPLSVSRSGGSFGFGGRTGGGGAGFGRSPAAAQSFGFDSSKGRASSVSEHAHAHSRASLWGSPTNSAAGSRGFPSVVVSSYSVGSPRTTPHSSVRTQGRPPFQIQVTPPDHADRRSESAPTILKPIASSPVHKHQLQKTSSENASRMRALRGQRPSPVRAAAVHIGISNAITHHTIPHLNRPLRGGTSQPNGASRPTIAVGGKKGRRARMKQKLFLDCQAVENEKCNVPPPLSCIAGMNAASTSICSEICDGVFVGGSVIARDGAELKKLGITHVVNCVANQCPCLSGTSLRYLSFSIRDNGREDITKYLYCVFAFIEEAQRCGGKVLLHCMKGISRSGSLAIAWVIQHMGKSFDEAYSFCRSRRPAIDPNMTFVAQLDDWAKNRPCQHPPQVTHVFKVTAAPAIARTSLAGKGAGGLLSVQSKGFSNAFPESPFESSSDSSSFEGHGILGGDDRSPSPIDGAIGVSDDEDNDGNASHLGEGREIDLDQAIAPSGGASQQRDVLNMTGENCLLPLLEGPLSDFNTRMFSSPSENGNYIVVAEGVLFLRQLQGTDDATPTEGQGATGQGAAQNIQTTNGSDSRNSLSESQNRSRSRNLLESAAELLKRFENCGSRTLQWVEDGAEPPEFWVTFSHIPEVCTKTYVVPTLCLWLF